MIFICLIVLYGVLFISDIAVVTYPLRQYARGTLNAQSFNTQKKITFYSRGINFLILPIAGLIVDLNTGNDKVLELVFWMIASSVLTIFFCIIFFKLNNPNLQILRLKDLDYWNLFYCLHYIGLPCVIYFATIYNEYRATIMQFSTILNFVSNYIIIWKIDYAVNKLIDEGYSQDNSMQYLMSLLFLRFVSKLSLLLLIIWFLI